MGLAEAASHLRVLAGGDGAGQGIPAPAGHCAGVSKAAIRAMTFVIRGYGICHCCITPPTMGVSMRVPAVLVCFFAIALAGCGASPSSEGPHPSELQSASDEVATPSPNYTEVKKGVYYYTTGISENDQKDGRAAGGVVGFRYKGKNADGDFVVKMIDGGLATCSDPCKIIHLDDGEAIAFNPNSVIGGAFEDAINGFLKQKGGK